MIHNIDPVFLAIGPLKIHYYGIIYMTAFLMIYWLLLRMVKKKVLPSSLTKKDIEQYIFYLVIWTVVGSRLFEVLFYGFSFYLKHPLKVFAIWEGGLSFHGGALAFISYSFYFAKKHRVPSLQFLDICAIAVSLGLCLGRIANFINGELYGLAVENQVSPPWYGVLFSKTDPQGLYRYPVQLFESFAYLITFFILIFIFKQFQKKDRSKWPYGILGFSFLFLYGFFRFIIEYWKDYARDIAFGLTTGQLLCFPMVIIGIAGIIATLRLSKKKR